MCIARGLTQSSGVAAVVLVPLLGAALGATVAGLLVAIRAAVRHRLVARS